MKKLWLLALLIILCGPTYGAVDLNDTNLRQKIAQMLIVGFNGTKLTPENPIYDDIINERISGVIIFSRDASISKDAKGSGKNYKNVQNPKQLKKLISDIKAASKIKPFISIDQEGGMISRLPSERGFDVKTLSHKELGDKNDEMATYLEAKKIASTLKDLGVNMNFAPCVDLALNPNSPVIYKLNRSFSDNPQVVIKHANAYILAHKQYEIITVLKHFPGHGSASGDSHKGFTDATNNWNKIELEPYQALISGGMADGVMVSHIYNKNLDEIYPASLSHKTISELLKNKMGFMGLVVTDDIQMQAISANYTFEQALINALNAGNDLIIIGNNLNYDKDVAKKFNDIIFNAVKDGKIPIERIDEAHAKIIKIKDRL